MATIAFHARQYYEQKQKMAVGCEPTVVGELITTLHKQNLIEAAWLAGAGKLDSVSIRVRLQNRSL